jgi:phytoene dehydrogenase-like protein
MPVEGVRTLSKVMIIGAGLGGLFAGNLLAARGHRVKIFESYSAPGGYTAGFRRKGFYFESGTLSFESSGMVFKAMREIGVFDQLNFVSQKSRWLAQDFDIVTESYESFKETIYRAFPADRENLTEYFAALDKMYYSTRVFIKNESMSLSSFFAYMINGLKMLGLFRKYSGVTLGQFTERFFAKGSRLYRLFGQIGYPEMAAYIVGGALATIFDDYWTVKDGMQSWADVLAENFRSLGGELQLNSLVDRIVTENGKAVGVTCNGETEKGDYVISAGDYKKTFLKLLDDRSLLAKDFQQKVEAAQVSEGMVTVYLGLSISNDRLHEYLKIPHVFYMKLDSEANVEDPHDRAYFKKSGVSLYSPSLHNGELAPEGKSSLMLQNIAPTGWMDNWGGGDREKYGALKRQAMEDMIDQATAVIPGLRDFIEFKDGATPLTYERYTHNTGGASSAWSWNPKKKFHKSMMKSYVDTPVKNLYIGSCWASQIGGVPGALGAAYACARRIK